MVVKRRPASASEVFPTGKNERGGLLIWRERSDSIDYRFSSFPPIPYFHPPSHDVIRRVTVSALGC